MIASSRAGEISSPLPRHPFDDVVKAITSKGINALCAVASVRLILFLLISNDPLRGRILDALRRPDGLGHNWSGLARELRLLGILNLALHGQDDSGPPFRIEVEYDAHEQRLSFRSIPDADRKKAELDVRPQEIDSITWDHAEVEDALRLPCGRGRFFFIYIDPHRPVRFDHLHALFEKHEHHEMECLEELIRNPLGGSWRQCGGAADAIERSPGGTLSLHSAAAFHAENHGQVLARREGAERPCRGFLAYAAWAGAAASCFHSSNG